MSCILPRTYHRSHIVVAVYYLVDRSQSLFYFVSHSRVGSVDDDINTDDDDEQLQQCMALQVTTVD